MKLVNTSFLEVIYEAVVSGVPGPRMLSVLSPAFWKLLVRSWLKFMYVILNLMYIGACHAKLTPRAAIIANSM
jgi:hypothetical protein